MKRPILRNLTLAAMMLAATAGLTSCFTGIESTPKITQSDVKRENIRTSLEQTFLSDIHGQPFGSWQPGKRFIATDNRLATMSVTTPAQIGDISGRNLRYEGWRGGVSVTGDSVTDVTLLTPEGHRLTYRLSASPSVLWQRTDVDIPFTIEGSVVDSVAARIGRQTYYVITSLWYDRDDQSITGKKFVKATVDSVMPGNTVYPIKLIMRLEDDRLFNLFMSVGSSHKNPRGFGSLFSLTDPRLNYPSISDETWQNIINARVARGMSRDECKLALGAPNRIDRGTDNSYLYERWYYDSGIYLTFQDGILTSFRR